MPALHPRRAAVSLACHIVLAAAFLVFAEGSARSQTASAPGHEGLVVPPGSAPRYAGQQGRDQDYTEVLATGGQTGGSLGMVRQTVAPKSGPPLHRQDHEDEFYYVVSGDFDFQLGDRRVRVPAQSFVF